MEWYYAASSDRRGPVSDVEFQTLIDQGVITAQTLVWCDSMTDWLPLAATSRQSLPLAGALASAGACACAECGKTFAPGDIVQIMGSDVCVGCKDRVLDKMRMGLPIGGTAWRDGKKLVVADGSQLPDQCVKCNLPAEGGRMKRKVYWHPPLVYAALLVNILLYGILAMCFRKTVKMEIGVCPACRARRIRDLIIGWLALLGGIAVGAAGLAYGKPWGWAGPVLFLAGALWLILRTQVLLASRIQEKRAWLRGCHKDYLAKLPEWTGL